MKEIRLAMLDYWKIGEKDFHFGRNRGAYEDHHGLHKK